MSAAATTRIPVYGVRLVRERTHEAPACIRGPSDCHTLLASYLDGADREHFVVVLLDTQHQVRGIHTATVGIIDAAVIHPREVFKPAILCSAAAIILGHNHPSGDPTPSPEDREVTRQIVEAGRIIGIPVLDHVVIGEGRYCSFVEAGLLAV